MMRQFACPGMPHRGEAVFGRADISVVRWGRHSCQPNPPRLPGRQECLPHRTRRNTAPAALDSFLFAPHLIRYYGWYSNKARGMRRKAAETAAASSGEGSGKGDGPLATPEGPLRQMGTVPLSAPGRCSQTWAMLIKRVYEMDALACPECGGRMKVIAFIEPPQGAVIEKILRHCGLWHPSSPRPPPAEATRSVYDPDSDADGPNAIRRPIAGTGIRRHRHVRGHLLIFTDARRPWAVALVAGFAGHLRSHRSITVNREALQHVRSGVQGGRRAVRPWPNCPPPPCITTPSW